MRKEIKEDKTLWIFDSELPDNFNSDDLSERIRSKFGIDLGINALYDPITEKVQKIYFEIDKNSPLDLKKIEGFESEVKKESEITEEDLEEKKLERPFYQKLKAKIKKEIIKELKEEFKNRGG